MISYTSHIYYTNTSTIFSSLVNLDVIFCDESLETVVLTGITGCITGLLVDWGLSGKQVQMIFLNQVSNYNYSTIPLNWTDT